MLKSEFESLVGQEVHYLEYQHIEKAYMIDLFKTKQEIADFYKQYGIEPFRKMGELIKLIKKPNLINGHDIIDWVFEEYYKNRMPIRIVRTNGVISNYKDPIDYAQSPTLKPKALYDVIKKGVVDEHVTVVLRGDFEC